MGGRGGGKKREEKKRRERVEDSYLRYSRDIGPRRHVTKNHAWIGT
jgi:hypothetical protein